MNQVRKLLWLYLLLLIFEGALRKWVVPALDAPLLVIRDPLVLWIYFQAWRHQIFFTHNAFFFPNVILAVLATLFSTAFGWGNMIVTAYGVRTDFLQIPLIFLIPMVLDREDVVAMGKFILYAALPIAAIVLVQFRAPQDSWLNKGAMQTHYGTVRPSGVFSFIAGLVSYFALTASFILYGYLQHRTYRIWLLASSTFMILLAAACSGSRSCLVVIGIVAVVAVLCVITRGRGGLGLILVALVIALSVPLLSTLQIFQEGSDQMMQRFTDAGSTEGGTEGFIGRFITSMVGPLSDLGDVPIFGNGLGIGTNAGAGMLMGEREFVGPENEWARLVFESGPILGLMMCLFRIALTLTLLRAAFLAFARGNVLPILIFSAIGLLVLNGQWGVPTTLGFAIFGSGLTLAACRERQYDDVDEDEHELLPEDEEHADPDAADSVA